MLGQALTDDPIWHRGHSENVPYLPRRAADLGVVGVVGPEEGLHVAAPAGVHGVVDQVVLKSKEQ